jgi:hypothetical protein
MHITNALARLHTIAHLGNGAGDETQDLAIHLEIQRLEQRIRRAKREDRMEVARRTGLVLFAARALRDVIAARCPAVVEMEAQRYQTAVLRARQYEINGSLHVEA